MRRFTIVAPLLALAAACHSANVAQAPVPESQSAWVDVVARSSQEVGAGRYGPADRMLTDFAVRYPASPEASEAAYWRAIYKLDPANPNSSPKEAGALLDAYLTAGTETHRAEAAALRRMATALEMRTALAQGSATAVVKPADAPSAATDKAKDDELARLRDELAKANAELDRIKKRLAQPTKP